MTVRAPLASRAPVWTHRFWLPVACSALVGGSVYLICASPILGVLIFLGVVTLGIISARPFLGIAVVVMADGFALTTTMAGISGTVLQTYAFVAAAVGAASAVIRLGDYRRRYAPIAAFVVFVILCGSLSATANIPLLQTVQGARLLLVPLLCGVIGLSVSRRQMVLLMRLSTVVVVCSAAASAVENYLGVGQLVASGLDYGTTVRSFAGSLRAPGLFVTNYGLGSFAGVFGALALTWWPQLEPGKSGRGWRLVAAGASVICLLLSIYRTGILVLATAVVLLFIFDRRQGRLLRQMVLILGGAAFFVYVETAGFTSSSSLFERFSVWGAVLAQYPLKAFGYGLGFSGSASGSRFAERQIVVDNYFMSLGLQFGLLAIVMVLVVVFIAIRSLTLSTRQPILSSASTLLAVVIAFLFVDFWEYTAATSLVVAAVAFSGQRVVAERTLVGPNATKLPSRSLSKVKGVSDAWRVGLR